jgi:hypothetical protein
LKESRLEMLEGGKTPMHAQVPNSTA